MPRLCERDDDVDLLAGAFLQRLNKEAGTAKKLTAGSIKCLRGHDWPGNVRELRNLIERAFIDAGDEIEPANLFLQDSPALKTAGPGLVLELGISLAEAQQRRSPVRAHDPVSDQTRSRSCVTPSRLAQCAQQ